MKQQPKTRLLEPEEIQRLFDRMKFEYGMSEKAVFDAAFPSDPARAYAALGPFLRNVRTCPAEVISFCEEMLAPATIKAAE